MSPKKLFIAICLFLPVIGFAQNKVYPTPSEEEWYVRRYYEAELDSLRAETRHQKETINQLQEEVSNLKEDLLNIAVNYIFIPFDEFSITQIAIPSFQKSKDLPIFKEDPQYMIVLDLVQNYETDSKTVTKLIRDARTAIKNKAQAQKLYNELLISPLYKRYTQFNDWEETYLGKIIKIVADQLRNPTPQSDKIIAEIGSKHFAIMDLIKVPETPAPQPSPATHPNSED